MKSKKSEVIGKFYKNSRRQGIERERIQKLKFFNWPGQELWVALVCSFNEKSESLALFLALGFFNVFSPGGRSLDAMDVPHCRADPAHPAATTGAFFCAAGGKSWRSCFHGSRGGPNKFAGGANECRAGGNERHGVDSWRDFLDGVGRRPVG